MAFVKSLVNLEYPLESTLLSTDAWGIDTARNLLVEGALEAGVEYIFFLDSDMVVPPDTLSTLIGNQQDIVTGMYRERRPPFSWAVGQHRDGRNLWLQETPRTLFKVDFCGAGVLLVRSNVFREIKHPWFRWITQERDNRRWDSGEDVFFCEKAREQGFEIYADPRVLCEHIGMFKVVPGRAPPAPLATLGSVPMPAPPLPVTHGK